jgi:uncharacterized protein (TIGR02996 family)
MLPDLIAKFEALVADPQERAFLEALQAESEDDGLRLVYADWLEERGDPRSEYLRVEVQLANRIEDPRRRLALEARLSELQKHLNMLWTEVVARSACILNCGASDGRPLVRFTFLCPNQWGMLQPTDDPAVRFCAGCQQKVYRCETTAQARDHALSGHCIAISGQVAGTVAREQEAAMADCVGRPNPYSLWAQEIFSEVKRQESSPPVRPAKRWWQFWK